MIFRGTWCAAAAVAVVAAAAASAFLSARCPDPSPLRGARVLLTGASSGIGAEMAVQYARLGADLMLAARRAPELEATAAAALAVGGGGAVHWHVTDMASPAAVAGLVDAAAAAFGGRLDVLMLNHAAVDDALVVEYADAAALAAAAAPVLNANVLGSMLAARAALPALAAARGHIAVVSSASTIAPAPFHAVYVASKRALHGFFDTLRHELHLANVSVSIGVQVLGMIGTPAIMKDEGNRWLAISVPDAAGAMICAAQARWRTAFVPQWYSPMTALLNALGDEGREAAINFSYLFNVAEYVRRIGEAKAAWA